MALDESHRHQLYDALGTALGPGPAATLMSYLPPVGWADVATKDDLAMVRNDLAALEHRFDLRFAALEQTLEYRFQGLDHRFQGLEHRFDGLAHQVDGAVHRLAAELRAEMAAQTKAWFLSVVAITFTTAGLAFAAARLGGGG